MHTLVSPSPVSCELQACGSALVVASFRSPLTSYTVRAVLISFETKEIFFLSFFSRFFSSILKHYAAAGERSQGVGARAWMVGHCTFFFIFFSRTFILHFSL